MAPGQESLSSSLEVIEDSLSGTLKQQKVHVQMTNTIRALQEDMKKVMERLSYLESLAALQVTHVTQSETGAEGELLILYNISVNLFSTKEAHQVI